MTIRGLTLDNIHIFGKQTDNIDYLRYEMQKNKPGGDIL